jgi:lipopolysaccharide export system protein LptA
MKQAMIAQAKEDQKNRSQAVEVESINGQLDAYGDFVVTGQVKNVATLYCV